ncbi:class I SAM-dependent DNA methyltransferase [Ilyobacter polytropus]|uniref:Methyltransferase type 11 n=1 Tax=Ilyobacter polytropus (strain ATCC 51220 / DSM 2926 / LMG 16218 / CuHBu1) TaxID=572544 RepID=E3H892_ILYPC|nr:class I SAM-dependent methyltransferase [Ilyobacter polytropus]ADO81988.1 Methyltransferase type 11 [Ilyobacter polytropus DSM 2926]
MYQEFAKVYDKFMELADYDEWHDFVSYVIEGNNPGGKTLLDLGCGTGEVLKRFLEEYECTGVDISEDMLLVTREKLNDLGKDVPLLCQDMKELSLDKKYDIVISLFDTVNHLVSIGDLEKLFERIKIHLNTKGIYIFDVVDRNFMDEMFPDGFFIDQREDMTVIWEHYFEDQLDCIETTFFVEEKEGLYKKYREKHIKKIYTHKEIQEAAEKSGLHVENIYEESSLAGERFFYVIKK